MSTTDTYRLTDRYTRDDGTVFMTGIQALARLPIEQLRVDRSNGLRTAAFAAGYPGSPLAGIDGALSQAVAQTLELPIHLRPSVNEEYAATAVMGSQLATTRDDARYDGVVGIWYGKAPGVDRASDALRHATFAGTDPLGGVVALAGDDPAAKSSTIPSSSAGVLADLNMPVLFPADPAEALDLGRHAIALSRATGLWVALKIVVDVADGSGTVDLDPYRITPVLPAVDGGAYFHRPDGNLLTPHTLDIEREILEVRKPLALEYAALNRLNRLTVDPADPWIGIVSSGNTYRELREALRALGLETDGDVESAGIRLLKLNMPVPFNTSTVRSFAAGLEQVLVVEEKNPTVELQVKDALYNASHHPAVVGRNDEAGNPLLPSRGALVSDNIVPALRERLTPRIGHRLRPATPEREHIALNVARTPYFCSGCPHNRSTVVDEGTLVGAGIGCHAMVMMGGEPRYGDISGITCMGTEGTQWIGMSPFVETDHAIQNLGDGTFFHSGQLAVTAAIASGTNITYKLLWNRAVAMTGGQDPTGQIDLDRVCHQLLAQGVRRVIITSEDPKRARSLALPVEVEVWHRDRLPEAQRILSAIEGVTVLIHDQRCAAELRRDRKRGRIKPPSTRVVINHRVCEGCGDCAAVSNCLSVQPIDTPFGRKTTIDQHSCNLDYSCIKGDCPAFIQITTKPDRPWRRKADSAESQFPAVPEGIADPPPCTDTDLNVHITGIGGTGVVTVSQIIGTAAMLEGSEVAGLDQTGLSQKAGPVVSDIRISTTQRSGSNRVAAGEADLLLAFDLLVASSWTGLSATDPGRTAVVGSLELTPPGIKTAHPEIEMPTQAELLMRLNDRARPGSSHWAGAAALTSALVGDSVGANIFVVGMAVQSGLLPISPQSLEQAIELNGVAVDLNLAAFRWGRWQIADPTMVAAAATEQNPPEPSRELPAVLAERVAALGTGDSQLSDDLSRFTAELIAFQNTKAALSYLDRLDEIAAATTAVDPALTLEIIAVTASGLFKLMAYKDEYEVARLMLDADGHQGVLEVAGPSDKVAWLLHPPSLRALGYSRKISFSVRWRPMFRLLASAKRLRGTPLDVFGWASVRRIERALPHEYLAALRDSLADGDLARTRQVAEAADLVRGFESVKLRNVERFRTRLAELAS
ncbi:MAG: indolepyruvate ferredoxin oxidoreductase family protein [Acidimicrobiaceae bacterium]|nr:indolepyruvate ferredoxin oxidoreductase family protein [Acidimicrobiia bacterium]MCY4492277.1 indolepyruvate ferredoxin oxidoreductase family protein [Acidimicrobiaceae bacterium]